MLRLAKIEMSKFYNLTFQNFKNFVGDEKSNRGQQNI